MKEESLNSLSIDTNKIPDPDNRPLLVKLVRRWGDLNTDAILDAHCQFFLIPSIEGFIAYRIEKNCAIIYGDPVCAPTDQMELAEAFRSHCKDKKLNIIYLIISEKFAKSVIHQKRGVLIQFGNKLILDPRENLFKIKNPKKSLLRKKVHHALKSGIMVNEYLGDDPALEIEIQQVGKSWLQSRHGPQIYLAHPSLFNDKNGKRWFYAKYQGRVIGFLILNRVEASSGWLLNNLVQTPNSPSGTSELLITTALDTLEKENCRCVIIGPVTSTKLNITGLGEFSLWFILKVFTLINHYFHLNGQRVFWRKFPSKTEPSYILFDKVNVRTVRALLDALNTTIS